MIVSSLNENESQEREQGGIMWREIEFHLYRGHLLTLRFLGGNGAGRLLFSLSLFFHFLSPENECVEGFFFFFFFLLLIFPPFSPLVKNVSYPCVLLCYLGPAPFNVLLRLIRPFQNDTSLFHVR